MMQTEPIAVPLGEPLTANCRDLVKSVALGHGLDAFEILVRPGEVCIRLAATPAIGGNSERFSEAVALTLIALHRYFDPTGRRQHSAEGASVTTDEETLRRRLTLRYAVLRAIFKRAGGAQKRPVSAQIIAQEAAIAFEDVILALQYLRGEGLVESMSINWDVGLTHRGIKEVEQSMLEPSKPTEHFPPKVIQNFYGAIGAVVHGAGATVTATQNSPGAQITVATGSAVVHDRLGAAIEAVRALDSDTARAIQELVNRIDSTSQFVAGSKTEAIEALTVVAEQCATPEAKRLPKSVLSPIVEKLRDSLSLSADVLQVWTTFGPSILTWLSIVLR